LFVVSKPNAFNARTTLRVSTTGWFRILMAKVPGSFYP